MQRQAAGDKVERLTGRNTAAREQAAEIASKLARAATDNMATVAAASPTMPELSSPARADSSV